MPDLEDSECPDEVADEHRDAATQSCAILSAVLVNKLDGFAHLVLSYQIV